jgi:hypothetical protein
VVWHILESFNVSSPKVYFEAIFPPTSFNWLYYQILILENVVDREKEDGAGIHRRDCVNCITILKERKEGFY